MEQEKANEHMKICEDTKTKKLIGELINATDPKFKQWVDNVLKDNKRFPCITPMTKFRTLETEPLKIEDRDDVVGPPPKCLVARTHYPSENVERLFTTL